MLTLEEGTILVRTARKAFFSLLEQNESLETLQRVSSRLEEKRGAYVRVGVFAGQGPNEQEIILGFTGYPMPNRSLYQSVIDASEAIAVRTVLLPEERNKISFEVTALSAPKALKAETPGQIAAMVKLGRDALMVSSGLNRAMVLPQTAVKSCRNEAEFLSECCMAAGLIADAWLTMPEISLLTFEAQIFREIDDDKKVLEICPPR